jgi:hypothetical protein
MPRRQGATTARIAVFTDVHANLPALDAALAEIDRLGVDATYHTGDAIGIGPFPAECLDRLLSRPSTQFLMGNHDAWFAFGLPDESLPGMPPDEREHQLWVHEQLDPALKPVVAVWLRVVAGSRAATRLPAPPAQRRRHVPVAAGARARYSVGAVPAADVDARVLRS